MHMPHIDGLALARTIGERGYDHGPMLMLTSTVDDQRAALEAAGVRVVITKPVRQSLLLESLVRLVSPSLPPTETTLAPARVSERASQPRVSLRPEPLIAGRVVRVLAAEDNEVNQEVLREIAEHVGVHITVVDNGKRALEELSRDHAFDLVLMDCQMPVMDGYEAASAIRQVESSLSRPRIPIIAVTAHALQGEREKVLAAGMDDYMTKPIDFDALRAKLLHWLASAPVLDVTVIAELRKLETAKRPRFFAELVERYTRSASDTLERLQAAVAAGDTAAVSELAHALKGSSRSVGASEVAAICERIEQHARGEAVGTGEPLARELQASYSRARLALEGAVATRDSQPGS
jgi:CheY-like chemotaxis protein